MNADHRRTAHTQEVTALPHPDYFIDVRWAETTAAPTSRPYFLKGIIEPRAVSIWFGPPGSGKTFLILYVAHAIARGAEVFGRRVHQAKTLYMALEGRGGIEIRLHALANKFGDCPAFGWSPTPFKMLSTVGGKPRINYQHVAALVDTIKSTGVGVVIIDTMNLTLDGADENDNAAMGLLIGEAGRIAEATGVHVAFIAHSPKSGTTTGPRGASSQLGNADVVVAISGEGICTASTFAPSGKIKDGAPFKLHFKLEGVELARDDDGDPITSCILQETEPSPAHPNRPLSAAYEAAYREICDLFCTSGEAVDVVPLARMSTQRCLKPQHINEHWVKTGRLDNEGKTPTALQKEGQRLRNALRDLGKIGLTQNWVWLVDKADTGGQ